MGRKPRQPRYYFSLRSPYSWLAHRELLEHHPDVAEQVEWRPFWEPDEKSAARLIELGGAFPYVPMSRAKHLYILQDVGRLAERLGRRVVWPVDREPVWEVPHLAYLVARREGLGREFVAAAYRARWEEGRNICDPAVVGELGAELGLDPEETAGAATDPDLREQGAGLLLDLCRDGVFGVPFFVQGFNRFWGWDRLPDFVAHLRAQTPGAESLPVPSGPGSVGPSSEEGHAGGCG
ncbi:2-hydroxychromene-2-carboxylate isomerase [Streptomyces sp. NPDC092296]|uniref:2-hydroxychromene-2-carboxylate isomerase n=1 Tax=Streptomyces sp. NPDC092296 TaxID=3366012 RepID=UPI00381C3AA6